jgi:hypothetical protein
MFSNEFIAHLDNIQKQNLDKGGYKFIELFETKFIQEKKLFKSHPDKSNSYYFDMIFSEFPQDNPEIINYKYFETHIKDICTKFEEYGFTFVRNKDGMESHMTFCINEDDNYNIEEYSDDYIPNIKTIRFFFRF